MASLRAAFRTAPRTHLLRPSPTSRIAPIARRTYAARTAVTRPATDEKDTEEAEQAQEDLFTEQGDPNMVGTVPIHPARTSHEGSMILIMWWYRTATTPILISLPRYLSSGSSGIRMRTGGIPLSGGTMARRCMRITIFWEFSQRQSIHISR